MNFILPKSLDEYLHIRLRQIEASDVTISILKIYVRHVFNFKSVYIVSRRTHLTFKTFLTAATISLVCGRAAASNDCAYGMGTSAPNQIRKFII